MLAQIMTMAVGVVASGAMAHHDFCQTRTADCLLGAVMTLGLFATIALGVGPQV